MLHEKNIQLLFLTSFLSQCQSIFIGDHLELLEALRYPLIDFQEFFCTMNSTGILLKYNQY